MSDFREEFNPRMRFNRTYGVATYFAPEDAAASFENRPFPRKDIGLIESCE